MCGKSVFLPKNKYDEAMNEQNLIQNSQRSRAEVEELNRLGGIRSGETRRRNRSRREWSLLLGLLPLGTLADDEKIAPVVKMMEAAGVGTEEQCWDAVEVAQQHRKAMEGDTASFRAVGELNGDIQRNVSLEVAPRKDAKDLLQKLKDGGRL